MSTEEFEEWFNEEYPLPPIVERGTVGRDFKKGCKKAYKAGLEQHRWIPVSERLPKMSGDYQVMRQINPYPACRGYTIKGFVWHTHDTVTHWKPIILPI